jgi:hypothetical protein
MYSGFSQGMPTTNADVINADLLAFSQKNEEERHRTINLLRFRNKNILQDFHSPPFVLKSFPNPNCDSIPYRCGAGARVLVRRVMVSEIAVVGRYLPSRLSLLSLLLVFSVVLNVFLARKLSSLAAIETRRSEVWPRVGTTVPPLEGRAVDGSQETLNYGKSHPIALS